MNYSSRLAVTWVTACLVSSFGFANGSQPSPDLPEGITAGDWGQIRSLIAAQRHEFQATPDGHVASNPGLQSIARFDGDSALIEIGSSNTRFGLALKSYGFAGDLITVNVPTFGACADGQELTYDWSDELSEWWLNDSRGFEHGFNVWKRPAGASGAETEEGRGPLTFTMDVLGTLTPKVNGVRTGLVLRDANGDAALRYDGLFAFDANGVALDSWLEVDDRTLRICVDDAGAAYPLVVDPVLQQAYLKASNTEVADGFGCSVALSGNTLVVGAPDEDSNATGVDGDESSNAGINSGAVYVFVRSGGSWSQEAYLKASNTDQGDEFGRTVAVSGDTVVVGTPSEDSDATGVNGNDSNNSALRTGATYVFVRSGATWSQQAYLKASNPDSTDEFGISIAVSGDTVVVGTPSEDSFSTGINGGQFRNSSQDSGAAYVFAGLVSPGIGDLVCVGTPNSSGFGGTLSASGSSVVTSNSLTLDIACCPAAVFGLVVTSSSNGGPIGTVSVGEGFLCIVNGQLGRFSALMTSQGGAATQVVDLGGVPNSLSGPTAVQPGDTYYFQFWHRDTLGGTPTSNLTSAISVLFE